MTKVNIVDTGPKPGALVYILPVGEYFVLGNTLYQRIPPTSDSGDLMCMDIKLSTPCFIKRDVQVAPVGEITISYRFKD